VLTLIKNKQGGYFIKDDKGDYWRAFVFLTNTKSYDQVLTENQAFEGGKAFGRFQRLLADLETSLIVDTIPNFHNIEYRLANFDKAIRENPTGRLSITIPNSTTYFWIKTTKRNVLLTLIPLCRVSWLMILAMLSVALSIQRPKMSRTIA